VDVFDPDLYPDEEFQRSWIRHYLTAWKKLNPPSPAQEELVVKTNGQTNGIVNGEGNNGVDEVFLTQESDSCLVSEKEIEELLSQVEKFAMSAHLMWGIWALIQSRHSKIDFDFRTYAKDRLLEYEKAKKKMNLSNGLSKM
jgi:hypothetical protein